MTAPNLLALAGLQGSVVRHAFFTRAGGVSGGLYASLNCSFGSGDDPAKVAENRGKACAALGLGADRLLTCHQVHSAEVVVVEQPWRREESPRADALVTRQPGLALGILTADCVPVLFADPAARVIGAAHAGWRGALGGVIEATVTAMCALGATPAALRAGIGPCIGRTSYEVGPEFPAPFIAEDPANASFFAAAARPGHFLFDLAAYVARRLTALRLLSVERTGGDTAAEGDWFFSYRRSCLRGEPDYGRELSAICLAE
jgi:YfiH family protein